MNKFLKKALKTKYSRQLLANGLITLGIVTISTAFMLTQFSTVTKPITKTEVITLQAPQTDTPAIISVGSLIDKLVVIPGEIDKNQWELAKNEAIYLKSGGMVSQNGNLIIFGHQTPQVFGELLKATEKDQITISTNAGLTYSYKIETIKKVSPSEVSILQQPTDRRQLTIFTSTGLFDSQRFVIIAHQI